MAIGYWPFASGSTGGSASQEYRAGEKALPPQSSRFSRKDFTQAQLFAILVLRQFFKVDYRGIVQLLQDPGELRDVLKLHKVPHYSTLCYAEGRLMKKGALPFC